MISSAVNKYTGLVFLLEGNSFMKVVVSEDYAKWLVDTFVKTGQLPNVIGSSNQPTPLGAGAWAIQTSAIRGIHTAPLEEQRHIPPYQRTGSGL